MVEGLTTVPAAVDGAVVDCCFGPDRFGARKKKHLLANGDRSFDDLLPFAGDSLVGVDVVHWEVEDDVFEELVGSKNFFY